MRYANCYNSNCLKDNMHNFSLFELGLIWLRCKVIATKLVTTWKLAGKCSRIEESLGVKRVQGLHIPKKRGIPEMPASLCLPKGKTKKARRSCQIESLLLQESACDAILSWFEIVSPLAPLGTRNFFYRYIKYFTNINL